MELELKEISCCVQITQITGIRHSLSPPPPLG